MKTPLWYFGPFAGGFAVPSVALLLSHRLHHLGQSRAQDPVHIPPSRDEGMRIENQMLLLLLRNHCSIWTWVVKEILTFFGRRLRSTYCREFLHMKLCRPAYFFRTTQFKSVSKASAIYPRSLAQSYIVSYYLRWVRLLGQIV